MTYNMALEGGTLDVEVCAGCGCLVATAMTGIHRCVEPPVAEGREVLTFLADVDPAQLEARALELMAEDNERNATARGFLKALEEAAVQWYS